MNQGITDSNRIPNLGMPNFATRDRSGNYFLQLIKEGNPEGAITHLNNYKQHININDSDNEGESALHLAIKSNYIPLALKIIEMSPDVHREDSSGVSPLALALDHDDILWAILNNETIKMNSLALRIFIKALENKSEQVVLKFFEKGFVFLPFLSEMALKVFETAFKRGFDSTAKKVLSAELINMMNSKQRYDLFEQALKYKFYDFALLLIQTLPRTEFHSDRDEYRTLYIEQACKQGTLDIARDLVLISDFSPKWLTSPLLYEVALREGFEKILALIIDKIPANKRFRNEYLCILCKKILGEYPPLIKEKMAEVIIQRLVPSNKKEDVNQVDDLFRQAVKQNCERIISLFLAKENQHLAPSSKTLLSLLLEAISKSKQSRVIQLVNYWISSDLNSEELEKALKEVIFSEGPSTSLWCFNTLFQSELFLKSHPQIIQQAFTQLIQAAYDGKLTGFETDFFQQAQKILSPKQIASILICTMKLDKLKKETEESTEVTNWNKVINLLTVIGSKAARTYLRSGLTEILENLKNHGVQGHLSCTEAQALAKMFPETTLIFDVVDEHTEERRSLELNFFILVANSSFFRTYFSSRWEKRDFVLHVNPTLFNILYQAISENKFELSNLNQEGLSALKEVANKFEVDLPILKLYTVDGYHIKSFYDLFCKNSYSSHSQTELIIDHYFFYYWLESRKSAVDTQNVMEYYLKNLPNIEVIKTSSILNPTDDVLENWNKIITLLPKLKEIHIDFKNTQTNVSSPFASEFIKLLSRIKHCEFYLEGTQKLDKPLLQTILSTSYLMLKGLDLSGRKNLDIHRYDIPTTYLQYLNLSDSSFDEKELIDFVKKAPHLREVNLRNCPTVTDQVLSILASKCSKLESVNLCGNDKVNILQFVTNCPHLTTLKISSASEEELEKIMKVSRGLFSLYVGEKQVLSEEDNPQTISSLMQIIDQKDLYLLESTLILMLKMVLNDIALHGKFASDYQEVTVKILDKIREKKSDSFHLLISYMKSFKKSQLKDFCLVLAGFKDLRLDKYLPKEFIQQLRRELGECQPNLSEARKLSKLFEGDKIEIYIKKSKAPFSFDPLVLQSTKSEILQAFAKMKKAKVFSHPLIFKYIHLYLTEGEVELNLSIHAYLEICRELVKYELSLEEFFNEAKRGSIGLKLKAYTNAKIINEFLNYPKIIDLIEKIDLTKIDLESNLQSILELVMAVKNLKLVRLTTNSSIPDELWNAFRKRKQDMKIVLTLGDHEKLKEFNFPPLSSEDGIHFRLEKIKGSQFPSLSEYIEFIKLCPQLIEIDVSGYQLSTDSTELHEIISLCKSKNITTLELGDCTKLSEKDLDLIAKNCLGIQTLVSNQPERINKAFIKNGRLINCDQM